MVKAMEKRKRRIEPSWELADPSIAIGTCVMFFLWLLVIALIMIFCKPN